MVWQGKVLPKGRLGRKMSVTVPWAPGITWSPTASNRNIIVEFCQGWGRSFWQKNLVFPAVSGGGGWAGSQWENCFYTLHMVILKILGVTCVQGKLTLITHETADEGKDKTQEIKKFRSSFPEQCEICSCLYGCNIFWGFFSCRHYWDTQTLSYFHKAQWHHPPGNPKSGESKTGSYSLKIR